MQDNYKLFWKRNLPHIQPADTPLFINYNLKLNIPVELKYLIHQKHKYQKSNIDECWGEVRGSE